MTTAGPKGPTSPSVLRRTALSGEIRGIETGFARLRCPPTPVNHKGEGSPSLKLVTQQGVEERFNFSGAERGGTKGGQKYLLKKVIKGQGAG